jgi:hypothetical protein
MQQIEATGWIPQVVLFDWIGGGLDAMVNKDWLRLYYQDAADLLINHGKRTKRIMLMAAQLDKSQVTGNTPRVTMAMLSECKTMTNNLTNFLGLTTLRDKTPQDDSSSIKIRQYICVDKATRGITGTCVPVALAFKFQRITESTADRLVSSGGG